MSKVFDVTKSVAPKGRTILLAEDLNRVRGDSDNSYLVSQFSEEISRRLDMPLSVLYIQNTPKSLFQKNRSPVLSATQKEVFESLYKTMSGEASNVGFYVEEGEVAETLLSWSERIDVPSPRFIIVSAGKGAGVKKTFLGKVTENLVAHAKVPLLIFGPAAIENGFQIDEAKRLKILLITDLSRMSRMAEVYAHYIARKTGGHIVLCHSHAERVKDFKKSFTAHELTPENVEMISKNMLSESKRLYEKRLDYLKNRGISCEGLFLSEEKDFVKSVLHEVQDDYDLVLMGTVSHSQAALGGSARKILMKSPVPVLLCRASTITH
ncbi:universal stress protein [Bdellovibrio bacteriovorus W]|nr:universal stress protein [Bdellovibrio bacteriovorus W]